MKFQIEKATFEEQLNIVSRAINSKTTLPVLGNVLLKVENGTLFLTTTNLEIAIETSVPVMESTDGKTTIPVKLLQNYINLLPSGIVFIELKEKETMHITSNNSDTNIKGIPAEEFPIIPKSPEEVVFELNSKDIEKALNQTVFASAIDGRRPVLSGVFLQLKDQKLTVAATDSYRLAEKTMSVNVDKECAVIIPSHTVLELIRILTKQEAAEIKMQVSKNQIIFSIGSIFLISRLIEGVYPEYKKIIPDTIETTVQISGNEFSTILKRVNLFAREVSSGVKFSIHQEGIDIISDNAQSGTEKATYNCPVTGPEKLVSFNAEYMLDAISNMDGENIIFGINDALSPGVLRNPEDANYTHIVMPLKI